MGRRDNNNEKHLIDQERREGVDLESTISHQFVRIITRFKNQKCLLLFYCTFCARVPTDDIYFLLLQRCRSLCGERCPSVC